MNPQTRVDPQRVFLTYCELFTGQNASVRKTKTIRNIVLNHLSASKESTDTAHIEEILPILKALLANRIFESKEQASKIFSDSYSELPQDRLAGNIPKKRKASSGRSIKVGSKFRNKSVDGLSSGVVAGISNSLEERLTCSVLQPPRFPFDIQYHILSVTQKILEESCFYFAKLWLPSLLEERGWNCAAAVELTKWLYVIKQHLNILPEGCMSTTQQASFKTNSRTVAQLRHAAVHRLHLESDQLLAQVHSAHMLAEALQDNRRKARLEILHARLEKYVKKMYHDVDKMKEKVDEQVFEIETQREALHQRELLLQRSIARQQIDIPVSAGQALLQSIENVFDPLESIVTTPNTSMDTCDEHDICISSSVTINEADIESDEDQLRAEL